MRLSHTNTILMYHLQNGKCFYCKTSLFDYVMAGGIIEIDHKHPVAKGGSNDYSNLCFVCKRCNSTKNSRTEEEFIDYIKPFLVGIVKWKFLAKLNRLMNLWQSFTNNGCRMTLQVEEDFRLGFGVYAGEMVSDVARKDYGYLSDLIHSDIVNLVLSEHIADIIKQVLDYDIT